MKKTKVFILAFLEYFTFSNKFFFWYYTKNLACRVLKILRQKCIVLKFLNPKFQLLNLRKWWFYVGLKPWHYLWDTLYKLNNKPSISRSVYAKTKAKVSLSLMVTGLRYSVCIYPKIWLDVEIIWLWGNGPPSKALNRA